MHIKNPIGTFVRVFFLKVPIESQLIITRRCNLSCGYCTEYDNFSEPISIDVLKNRIDGLHRLRVIDINLLGGEPLLHPNIVELVAYANRSAQVSITTNGFLISDNLIMSLNEAGLCNMQISLDTLYPDHSNHIQKTLKSMAFKLERLKQLADFDININVVLCEGSTNQFRATIDKLRCYGFPISVNLVHDENGKVAITGSCYLELWEYYNQRGRPAFMTEYDYYTRLLQGQHPKWQCRAGGRYLYVDEFGKAQFCSAQRGRLDIPISHYTKADIDKHSRTHKGCEAGCTMSCAYRASLVDNAPFHVLTSFLRNLRDARK